MRRVQPDVHAGAKRASQRHVVVFQVNDRHVAAQFRGCRKYLANQLLARLIAWVGFARKDDLKRSHSLGNPPKTFQIRKEQVGPLVWSCSAGKAKRQCLRVELDLDPALHFAQ